MEIEGLFFLFFQKILIGLLFWYVYVQPDQFHRESEEIYCKGKSPYNYKDKFYYNILQIYVIIIMWTVNLVHKKFSKIQRTIIL